MTTINAILTDGSNVDMPALRAYLADMEGALAQANSALASGTIAALVGDRVYASQSALYADLVPADNLFALVYADADPLKNGLYQKDGATTAGDWEGPFDLFASAAEAAVQPLVDAAEAAATAAQNAATPIRPNLFEPARSIYDPRANTVGTAIAVDGTFSDLGPAYSTTDYLPVRPGGKVKFSQAQTYGGAGFGPVFFNASREVVGSDEGSIVAEQVSDVPAYGVLMRFPIETARAATMVVTDADYDGEFTPADGEPLSSASLAGDLIRSAFAENNENIFNLDNTVAGALNAELGTLDAPGGFLTATIDIDPSVPLRFGAQTDVGVGYGPTFVDKNDLPVWARRITTADGDILQPPSAARKVRIPLLTSAAEEFTLRKWGLPQAGPLAGTEWGILGDSLSADYPWLQETLSYFGATVRTYAARPGRIAAEALKAADGVTDLTAEDFEGLAGFVILLGTNQDSLTPIGNINTAAGVPNFVGQIRNAIETPLTWNPNMKCVMGIPPYRENGTSFELEKLQQARDALRTLASGAHYALPVLDFYNISGVSPFTKPWRNNGEGVPDGIHPTPAAYRRLIIPAARGFFQTLAPVV